MPDLSIVAQRVDASVVAGMHITVRPVDADGNPFVGNERSPPWDHVLVFPNEITDNTDSSGGAIITLAESAPGTFYEMRTRLGREITKFYFKMPLTDANLIDLTLYTRPFHEADVSS